MGVRRAAQRQVAEQMGVSSGAMTNRLDRMETAGLIRRIPDLMRAFPAGAHHAPPPDED
jgi:DNA-binding MarR family transcriptional regulator